MMTRTCFVVLCFLASESIGQETHCDILPDSKATRAIYKALILGKDLSFVHSQNDSVSVALEYLQLRDTILTGKIGDRVDQFVGFLRGRVRVTPPKWWVSTFKNGDVFANRKVHFTDSTPLEKLWQTSSSGCRFAGILDLEIVGARMTLDGNMESVTVLREDFKSALRSDREKWDCLSNVDSDTGIVAAIEKGKFAIIFECPDEGPLGPREMIYGDVQTGKPIRSVPLMDGLDIQGGGDWGKAYSEIILEDSRMMVFGAHGRSLTIHVFEIATGKCQLLFVTSFLDGLYLKNGIVMDAKEKK